MRRITDELELGIAVAEGLALWKRVRDVTAVTTWCSFDQSEYVGRMDVLFSVYEVCAEQPGINLFWESVE